MIKRSIFGFLIAAVLLLAGCGDDGEAETSAPAADDASTEADDPTPENDDTTPDAPGEDFVEDLVDDLEQTQASQGGGSATLTIGDQTWTFDSVLCAFGEEMIGQEGAEFVLSSIQDGMQMYVSIDSFGHSVSLDDIEDFTNPSVSVASGFGAGDFIVLDGKNVSAETGFIDNTSDDFTETPGTFTATCP
jgi:hypothetical protein